MKSMILGRSKIGYIKINSVNGQVTFSVFEVAGGLIFKKPNIHLDRTKPSNIIHLNVDNELFIEYSPQIKQHIDMLIRMYLDFELSSQVSNGRSPEEVKPPKKPLHINEFTLAMHKLAVSQPVSKKLKDTLKLRHL